ncbi:c-type cytochrome [Salirhabdus sp. Marseille-P4669]|uniref:c-type cytochrome n=1 Tax=Salirhabdus sp. Marseille-P4669 TaxID=2042310 RepID=UPI000C7A619B|nr:cytochrome c [Salirhabdus sp. Marseille-P4669]
MKQKLLALLFGSVLVLAACGGGDEDTGDDTGANEDTGTDTEQPADEGGTTDEGNATDDGNATDEGTTTEEGEEDNNAAEDPESETGEEGDAGTVDTAAAEKIYQNNCSMCHGADLAGAVGPNLQQVGARYSQEEIQNIIQNGKGGMQAVNISDEDANTVATWLAAKK